MVSQSLEILRQGVWASLTGGWFFDPHQDVYCNTFHLYLWMFLLCFPFTIYLYSPLEEFLWYIYCLFVTIVFGTIKLVNLGLHHMYDTTECIQIESEDNRPESERRRDGPRTSKRIREDEGIELQELSGKRVSDGSSNASFNAAFMEFMSGARGPEIESIDSTDYPRNSDCAPVNVDLKVDVHRKNSSESSEEMPFRPAIDATLALDKETQTSGPMYLKLSENQSKQSSCSFNAAAAAFPCRNQDSVVENSAKRHRHRSNAVIHNRKPRKLTRQTSVDSRDDSLGEASLAITLPSTRRHTSATNSSLGCLPVADEINIKATGSLELGYIEYKSPNTSFTGEGFSYWKNNARTGVRRIRSTALETCCPPATNLVPHPNSLEVIGASQGTSNRNPILPPPSTTLVRNPHLCPYFSYGSEIVYPIAEQSDEHQTSHGPDTDIESVHQNSDSDYEEQNTGSRSPLLVRLEALDTNGKVIEPPLNSRIGNIKKSETRDKRKPRKAVKNNTLVQKISGNSYSTGSLDNNYSVLYHKQFESEDNGERASATSKDALLENDVSNSSATPEMHDARTDCNATDNDNSERKLSESSLCTDSDGSLDVRDENCEIYRTKVEKINSELTMLENRGSEEVTESGLCQTNGMESSLRITKRRKNKRTATAASQTSSNEDQADCASIMGLQCLFETSNNDTTNGPETKDTPPQDADSGSSSTTISIENEVHKLITDDIFSSRAWYSSNISNEGIIEHRNLGAIPKQNRTQHHRQSLRDTENERRPRAINTVSKTETERRPRRRHSNRNRDSNSDTNDFSVGEVGGNVLVCSKDSHKNLSLNHTNKLIQNQSSLEGLECLVNNSTCVQRPSKRALSRHNSKNTTRTRRRNSSCNEASSSSSNNELSTLLPATATPLLAAFLESRRHLPAYLPSRNCGESVILRPVSPPQHCRLKRSAPVSRRVRTNPHIAASHNDTSDGSMHCFRDENGSWWTYTFDERGTGVGLPFAPANTNGRLLHTLLRQQHNQNQLAVTGSDMGWPEHTEAVSNSSLSLNSSGLTVVLDSPVTPVQSTSYSVEVPHASPLPTERGAIAPPLSSQGETDTEIPKGILRNWDYMPAPNYVFPKPKYYYKYKLWPRTFIRVYTDRLSLLALLDRNLSFWETMLSVILASLVACFGATLLRLKFYEDLYAFLFCFVIAGCQYSLVKSVQPDAASPTHGFNRIMAFSRPVYFCMCSSLVIILHYSILNKTHETAVPIYGLYLSNTGVLQIIKDLLATCLLCFPVAFSLGLCPQINTFTMYFLEQIDMHIFGGNAMSSLIGAFYSLFRSTFAVLVLYGFAYGALLEDKCAQHILYSMFCGCLIPCAYHLSRCASDPANMWYILKTHFWPPDIYREPNRKITTMPVEKTSSSNAATATKKKTTTADPVIPKTKQLRTAEIALNSKTKTSDSELIDPLPQKLQKTVNLRLKNDILICSVVSLLVFGLHTTSVFSVLKKEVCDGFKLSLVTLGFILHYIIPQLRKQLPWLCIARPVLRSHEHGLFEVREAARVMWFEKVYVYFCFIERNLLYPILFLMTLTQDARMVNEKFGPYGAALILVVCGLKIIRGSYSDSSSQYLILGFTMLFFRWDFAASSETFLVDYFLVTILFNKTCDLLLKLQFVVTYIAPWQITWGSAFHAFAQPFSVPHSAMLFLQTVISAVLSTPLNPFLGSAIFLTSYVRPIKFWERDYNTRRVDHSNTRLSSHLERNLGADDNNLNSIFYEHLTRSLQHSLCGDLMLGRWGHVSQGDCFVLASDYLNCLVHIIEKGNGLVTFQMRGLEFRGTYCQQREVEAISEGVEENDGCCCYELGHLPNMLSVNAAFSQRWLAWEVTAGKYVLEGYSISDNSAISMLQVFDFRKVLITYYVKSIIFYVTRSAKLDEWLKNPNILEALGPLFDRNFVDLDPVFNINIDEDFDFRCAGITRSSFCNIYHEWIQYCATKRNKNLECDRDSSLVLLCFALSLLGRRTLGAASHNTVSSVEFFLYGLHALFKGDFRITSMRDEWVFMDVELLRKVVAPAVRMSLKLHQDHFREPEGYSEPAALYVAISDHNDNLVISHEGDPAWRNAVLSGTPSLLALRHVLDEGTDEYKIIMLNKRFLSFRVIKINRECVRGLWSGQQQELVYLRNRNPERGSIQNAKQALRNIINSSCDQPIGYPIYVSPLTTSYAETNDQLCSLIGGSLTLKVIKNNIIQIWKTIRRRCGEGCLSGGSVGRTAEEGGFGNEGIYAMTACTLHGSLHSAPGHSTETIRAGSLGRSSLGGNRGSMISIGKPASSTLANLAGLLSDGGSFNRKERREDLSVSTSTGLEQSSISETNEPKSVPHRVRIIDPNVVYDAINLGRRIDVTWPDEKMRARGGRSYWKDWLPEKDMEGTVVHRWVPNHRDPNRRSHVDRTILLIKIDDKYVPIAESAVQDLGAEV